jgi:hypothetical protein
MAFGPIQHLVMGLPTRRVAKDLVTLLVAAPTQVAHMAVVAVTAATSAAQWAVAAWAVAARLVVAATAVLLGEVTTELAASAQA